MKNLLINNIHLINNKFIRFLVVGGINTIFGYFIFALLLYVGLHYSIAAMGATVLGVLFNFKTTGRLVFNSHDNRLILKFISVYVVLYVINVFVLKIFKSYEMNLYLAGALMLLPMALLGFFLNKTLVFKVQENVFPNAIN